MTPVSVHTLAAIALTGHAALGGGVSAAVVQVRAIDAVSHLPGEIGGPSVEITIRVVNNSARAINVANAVVNLNDAAGKPAVPVSTPPARPFRGAVAVGHSATGTYVFSVAKNRRSPITVFFNYAAGTPVARFVGPVQ